MKINERSVKSGLRAAVITVLVSALIGIAGCGESSAKPEQTGSAAVSASGAGQPSGSTETSASGAGQHSGVSEASASGIPSNAGVDSDWRIRVIDTSGEELFSFSESELSMIEHEQAGPFMSIYSTINNWPASRFYAADGYGVAAILDAAGVYYAAQTVLICAEDGYEARLTMDQLFCPRYYFPRVGEDGAGAETVPPMIAFRWREGSGDLSEIRADRPLFIFGQQTPHEQNNPAFVVGVTEIVVDFSVCEAWPPATTFPAPGVIGEGETVKLQHPFFGLVKMYYTLDGSDPTTLSALYNPSTYQTELNLPIPITGLTVIKVLVTGYGRADSEIAEFEFRPAE